MKNKISKFLLVCLGTFALGMSTVGCVQKSSPKAPESSEVDELDAKLHEIYDLAVQAGATTQTYEEWLASIRGQDGQDGQDGLTPYIGNNGNWWIGSTDTGVNATGPQGNPGNDGQPGTPGTPGTPGADGYSLLTGHGNPDPNEGKVGDSYVDLDTWNYYVKESEGWTLKGNFKGQDGSPGNPGSDGAPGSAGTPGANGSSLLTGHGEPDDLLGANNDSYVDLDTWNYYVKADGHWTLEGNFKGADGDDAQVVDVYHTLTFNPGLGQMVDNAETTMEVKHGESVASLPYASRTGYDFTGWYTGTGVHDDKFTCLTPVTRDLNLYAQYKENGDPIPETYTLTLVDVNGSQVVEQNFEEGAEVTIANLDYGSYAGNNFAGWYLNGDLYEEPTITIDSDITLTAHWEAIPITYYTLTINFGNGDEPYQDTHIAAGTVLNAAPVDNPIKDGYNFEGYCDATSHNPIEFPFTVNETVVWEAVWAEIPDPAVNLNFYTFNDLHGKINDSNDDNRAGISRTASYIAAQKALNDNTILLSQGDMWDGSYESNINQGELVSRWMENLDFEAMTLGNHEFSWGIRPIEENSQYVEMLGINILNRSNDKRADFASPSKVIDKGGVKIGVIGAIGNCYSSISRSQVADYYFATGEQLNTLIKAESTRLRNEEHCDLVVLSYHGSGSRDDSDSYDITLSSQGYIDLVLEGHTHNAYVETDSEDVYHIQSGAEGRYIGHINLTYNTDTDEYTVNVCENVPTVNFLSDYGLDQETEDLIDSYDFSAGEATIGQNRVLRDSAWLRQTVSRQYLNNGLTKWGSTYNIILGGGYISVRDPYNLQAGDVNYKQLYTLFPFDNEIVLIKVKGNVLLNNFVKSTHKDYYMTFTSAGQNFRENYSLVDLNEDYYVVTDTYTSDYLWDDCTIIDRYSYEEAVYARDLLKLYAEQGQFLSDNTYDHVTAVTHAGTFDDPYDITEAYKLAYNDELVNTYGYFKGKISHTETKLLSNGTLQRAYFYNNDKPTYMFATGFARISDATTEFGFKDLSEVKETHEVLFRAKLYKQVGLDGFILPYFGNAYAVTVDGDFIAGLDENNPINISAYKYSGIRDHTSEAIYIKDTVTSFTTEDNSLTGLVMAGTTITADTFTLKEGVTLNQIVADFDIEIKLDGTTCQVVRTSQPVHAGTFEDPYDISDALLACKLNGTTGAYSYVKGTVSNKGSVITSGGSKGGLRNLYLTDDSGKQLQVYSLYRYQSNISDVDPGFDSDTVSVDDEMIIYAKLMNYNNTTPEANPAYLYVHNDVEMTRKLVIEGDIYDGATVAVWAWKSGDGSTGRLMIVGSSHEVFLPAYLDSFIVIRLNPGGSYSNRQTEFPDDQNVYNRTWGDSTGNYHTFTFTNYSTGDNGYYLEGIWS